MAPKNERAQEWVGTMQAVWAARVSPSVLYRLAATRAVRSRLNGLGRLEFAAEDVARVGRDREAEMASA